MPKGSFLKLVFVLCVFFQSQAQELTYATVKHLPYFNTEAEEPTDYKKEMCVLDIHYPKVEKPTSVIVWYHGGGLTSGNHQIPEALLETGYVIVSASYRLSPKVKPEICIDDAVEALAWVFKNISKYNGDPNNIFVSGHSAGGYLALMSVMDESRLKNVGLDANTIAGVIPFSGHTITHFEIRKQQGIPEEA